MTPEIIREALYAGACVYWPGLTPQEYGDAARAAVASFDPDGTVSLEDLERAIREQLVARQGEPVIPFEMSKP